MENASKALLMAAGVFLAIMILSLLVFLYNQLTDYYEQKTENNIIMQATEFNRQYENYNRNQLRGSDLLSLMNKIIDYNERLAYDQNIEYKPILVEIEIGSTVLEQFRYPDINNNFSSHSDFIPEIINNKTGDPSKENDQKLRVITTREMELIENNKTVLPNLTISKLQKLASEISNIIVNEDSLLEYDIKNRIKRAKKLKSILELDDNFKVSATNGKYQDSYTRNIIKTSKEIAYEYYQYTQFKRAYFDCTEVIYDEKTGRICEMNFKVRKNASGNVQFN